MGTFLPPSLPRFYAFIDLRSLNSYYSLGLVSLHTIVPNSIVLVSPSAFNPCYQPDMYLSLGSTSRSELRRCFDVLTGSARYLNQAPGPVWLSRAVYSQLMSLGGRVPCNPSLTGPSARGSRIAFVFGLQLVRAYFRIVFQLSKNSITGTHRASETNSKCVGEIKSMDQLGSLSRYVVCYRTNHFYFFSFVGWIMIMSLSIAVRNLPLLIFDVC